MNGLEATRLGTFQKWYMYIKVVQVRLLLGCCEAQSSINLQVIKSLYHLWVRRTALTLVTKCYQQLWIYINLFN